MVPAKPLRTGADVTRSLHDWRPELLAELQLRQRPDGSFASLDTSLK